MKQVKLEKIVIQYSDGSGVKVIPYKATDDHNQVIKPERIDFGLDYFDKKGKTTEYEGSWKEEQLISWISEVISEENFDYDVAFNELENKYLIRK